MHALQEAELVLVGMTIETSGSGAVVTGSAPAGMRHCARFAVEAMPER